MKMTSAPMTLPALVRGTAAEATMNDVPMMNGMAGHQVRSWPQPASPDENVVRKAPSRMAHVDANTTPKLSRDWNTRSITTPEMISRQGQRLSQPIKTWLL